MMMLRDVCGTLDDSRYGSAGSQLAATCHAWAPGMMPHHAPMTRACAQSPVVCCDAHAAFILQEG
jgi:hypothetical protein